MRYRYGVLFGLFFLSIITYVDRVCISVAGKAMQTDLGLTPILWGWVLSVFSISYAIFEIPSGALADRIGARKVLTRIVIWWSAFTSLTGVVSSFPALLAVRFAFGAGEAGAYPGAASSISRWFPVTQRARAASIVWMASRLGGALTPALVIPIQQVYGWRMSFYVFGIAGVVWALVWWWWYRDRPELKRGVTKQEIVEIGNPPAGAHQSLPWASVVRSKNFWLILSMYHTYCWGSYFYLSWMPTFLVNGRGFSQDEIKVLAPWPFLAGAVGNLIGGQTSDFLSRRYGLKIGRRTVGGIGLFLSGCFMLACSQTPGKLPAIILLSLGYFSMDAMLPVAWAVCMDVGRKYGGAVSGSMNTAGQVGSFLSTTLFGYIVSWSGGSYNAPLVPFGLSLMISAYLFTRINPEEQLVPEGMDSAQSLPRAA